jgi:hypothetical protein
VNWVVMRRLGYGTITVLLFLLVLAHMSSTAAPPRPIPSGATAATGATLPAQLAAFHQRIIVGAYKRVGVHNPAWDEAAVRYLDDYIRAIDRLPNAPEYSALVPRGKALVEAGCNDPQVLYVYGTALHQTERFAEAEAILRRAVTGFDAGTHPRLRARLAPRRLLEVCEATGGGKPEERARWAELAIRWTAEGLADGSVQQDESRLALLELEKNWAPFYADRFPKIAAALAAHPAADPYVVNLLKGRDAAARGWTARGTVREPTAEAMKAFREGMAVARACFSEAWKAHPEYPEAAAAMIPLAMAGVAGRGETPRLWFDRAVAAQIDYLPAYAAYREALAPRWGGSAEALYAFALECLRTRRFDTDVPMEFFTTLRAIETLTGDRAYWRKLEAYLGMKGLCDGYAKSGRGGDAAWYRTLCAAAAWYNGNYGEARRLLDGQGNKVQGAVFTRYFGARYELVRPEIHALASAAAPKITRARALETRNSAEALKIYTTVLAGLTDERAKMFVQRRIGELRTQAQLASGGWIDITPDPRLTGWQRVAGTWSVTKDGSLKGASGRDGLRIVCEREFGERVEVRGEIVFLRSPYTQFNAAVLVGVPRGAEDFISVAAYARENRACLRRRFDDATATNVTARVKDANTFLIQVNRTSVTVYLNGQQVAKEVTVAGVAGPRIGLGGHYWYPGAEIAFRRLQARRVPPPAPPKGVANGASAGAAPQHRAPR